MFGMTANAKNTRGKIVAPSFATFVSLGRVDAQLLTTDIHLE
jgi:hypothetical protein